MAWDEPAGSIRGLSRGVAAWRPSPERHNIWELVVYVSYWKYAVRRRLTAEKRGSFPLQGNNWWRRPIENTEAEWTRDMALLSGEHKALRAAVAALPAAKLMRQPPGSSSTYAALIRGVAAHDVYHAGQIQLLKRLASS